VDYSPLKCPYQAVITTLVLFTFFSWYKKEFCMKALLVRCLLVVTLGLLLTLALLLPGIKKATPASAYLPSSSAKLAPAANYHLWVFNEVFSCRDGSIQFIELVSPVNGQEVLINHQLRARNTALTQTKIFTFGINSGTPTANKSLLLATANFGVLSGGVTPDYIISSNFVFTNGGDLAILPFPGPTYFYAPGALPLDGLHSLGADSTTVAVNSPKNFAGQQGSVTCPGAVRSFIYLPLILKSFPPLPSEHDENLIFPSGDGN
jgi:hypothetical protein